MKLGLAMSRIESTDCPGCTNFYLRRQGLLAEMTERERNFREVGLAHQTGGH